MEGAEFIGMASTSGKLVYVDRYSGLVFEDNATCQGELYRVGYKHLKELDRYEGCMEVPAHYLRLNVEVVSASGVTQADTYIFQGYDKAKHPNLIENDWWAYIQKHPELNAFEQE